MQQVNISTEVTKRIEKKLKYYSAEQFCNDAKRYIKAIKEHRMFCVIHSVSSSGMSRNISFFAHEKNKNVKHNYFNLLGYNQFFIALGYTEANKGFRIGGCGMDMIFHTNYSIIHSLYNMNFISKKECEYLAQQTPTSIY